MWDPKWNGWHTALAIACITVVAGLSMAGRKPGNPHGVCRPALGEGTTLSVSSSASTQLTSDSDYEVNCTVDVYYEFGAAAPTADSNSMPHASGTWYFGTPVNESPYVAFIDQAGSSGTCEIRQCR